MTFAFRLLTADDLPMLHEWLHRPHVRHWWHEPATIGELERDYVSPGAAPTTPTTKTKHGDTPQTKKKTKIGR